VRLYCSLQLSPNISVVFLYSLAINFPLSRLDCPFLRGVGWNLLLCPGENLVVVFSVGAFGFAPLLCLFFNVFFFSEKLIFFALPPSLFSEKTGWGLGRWGLVCAGGWDLGCLAPLCGVLSRVRVSKEGCVCCLGEEMGVCARVHRVLPRGGRLVIPLVFRY